MERETGVVVANLVVKLVQKEGEEMSDEKEWEEEKISQQL